ncbi:MAG TPA: hypothetical protein VJL81_03830 [Solirubrobacterales bacterium]|nr:hypothetical protein [Solirubrobacterales bacterium]
MKSLALGVVAVLCLTLPQSAAAILVAEGSDSTSIPTAQAGGWLYSPSHVRVEVTADARAAVQVSVDLQCERGRSNRRVQHKLKSQSGSLSRRVPLPFGHPDDCYIGVTASYADFEQPGKITARILGHGSLNLY